MRGDRRARFAAVGAVTATLLVGAAGSLALLRGAEADAPSGTERPEARAGSASQPADSPPPEDCPGPHASPDGATSEAAADSTTDETADALADAGADSRAAAARALLRNSGVTPCGAAETALRSGTVDGRLLALLALLADRWSYDLPTLASGAGAPHATGAVLTRVTGPDGGPGAADAVAWLREQRGPFRAPVVERLGPDSVLVGMEPADTTLDPSHGPSIGGTHA